MTRLKYKIWHCNGKYRRLCRIVSIAVGAIVPSFILWWATGFRGGPVTILHAWGWL